MSNFDFIINVGLRNELEGDYNELYLCLNAKAWKAVHVLAGSIIEALLIDYIMSPEYKGTITVDPLKMRFVDLISSCKNDGILSSKAADLSSVVREYRNLIHAGKIIRLQEKADEPSAKVACALTDIIIQDIAKKRRSTYGYTAEQLVSKLERDDIAKNIFGHLLDEIRPHEIQRLILNVIPEKYLETIQAPPWDRNEKLLISLHKCYQTAFHCVDDEIKSQAAQKYITILKEEDGETVNLYGVAFFKPEYLSYLEEKDIDLVKTYYFSMLKEGLSKSVLLSLKGIGKYLNFADILKFIDPIIVEITYNKEGLNEAARQLLIGEYAQVSDDLVPHITKRINTWVNTFKRKENTEAVNTLNDLSSRLLRDDDFPF